VFHQRLGEELGIDVVHTAPTVPYRVRYGDEKRENAAVGDEKRENRVRDDKTGDNSTRDGTGDSTRNDTTAGDSATTEDSTTTGDDPNSGWHTISSPASFDQERLRKGGGSSVEEPVVDATIVCSVDVVGKVVELCVSNYSYTLRKTDTFLAKRKKGDASVPRTAGGDGERLFRYVLRVSQIPPPCVPIKD
jgi:hypothetical protein